MIHGVVRAYLISLLLPRLAGQLTVRLVGRTEWSGRLEVSYNGSWGTVCDDDFGKEEAQVVCRMLGYNSPGAVSVASNMYGEGSGTILLDQVNCEGTETSLADCGHQGFYKHNCDHSKDVGVICNIPGELTLRLVKGNKWSGLLEVLYNGTWSTVCDRGFDQAEVKVACRMLQIRSSYALALSMAPFLKGADEASILFSDLDCDGTETSLAQCKHSGFYNHTCTHNNDVGLSCELDAEYRLTGTLRTSLAMGRFEMLSGPITINGRRILERKWNAVCGNTYSATNTATVICRQLRHPSSGAVLIPASSFGEKVIGHWKTDSNCAGDEANIIACTQRITGYFPSCPKSREFGVICSDSNPGLYILLENNGTNEAFPPFEGTNVSLKCESTRQIELEANYTWPETAGGRPYGKYLIFDNVTRAHSKRRVKCGATYIKDGRREVVSSDPITMQVYYKPVIRILSDTSTCEPHASPSNTCYITKGQNVNLVCEAESNPIPALFQWSEKYISNNKKLQILSAHVSKHEGRYRCTVSTTIHDESDSRLPLSSSYLFTVIVQEPPAVLSFTANDEHNTTMMVDENSNVSLSCEAAGRPTPSMILTSDSNSRELSRILEDDLQSSDRTGKIVFVMHDMQCENSGTYRCEADNRAGQDRRTLKLFVPCAPRVRNREEKSVYVDVVNFRGSLTLEMVAYPQPYVKSMAIYGADVNDTVGGLLEDRINVTCAATTVAPALLTCNIAVVNVTDGDVYQIVFSNHLGDLTFNFTGRHIVYNIDIGEKLVLARDGDSIKLTIVNTINNGALSFAGDKDPSPHVVVTIGNST